MQYNTYGGVVTQKSIEVEVEGEKITVTQEGNTFYGVGTHAVVDLRQVGENVPEYICRGCGKKSQVLKGLAAQTTCRAAA